MPGPSHSLLFPYILSMPAWQDGPAFALWELQETTVHQSPQIMWLSDFRFGLQAAFLPGLEESAIYPESWE